MKTHALILAAGLGTRMKSKHSKALQPLAGQTMMDHVLDMVEEVGFTKKVAVVGYEKEAVIASCEGKGIGFAHQDERLGTGHAVMMAKSFIEEDEAVVVLNCDTPLLSTELIRDFIKFHIEGDYQASVITTYMDEPFGYGRIIRDGTGAVARIVEQKDATAQEREIREINSGIYVFSGKVLLESLAELKNDNAQGEYYLTDCIEIIRHKNGHVGGFVAEDSDELMGINTKAQLADAERIIRRRIAEHHMLAGVTIISPENVWIDKGVVIGRDTILHPNTYIRGNTVIGEDCIIGPGAVIEDMTIGNAVEIVHSTVQKSKIADETSVGPYAYIRPNSSIGSHVKIGDFVEVKNATVGDGTKVSHLSYIGDGDVGCGVNVGCGVVFVNYNGKDKSRTTVGDNAFIGCNVNLIAPVTVEDEAYVAAGSTITNNVPKHALAVARAKQSNIEGWVERRGLLKGRKKDK